MILNERLLQYIWNELLFDFRNLKTSSGQSLHILSKGTWNTGDGPDFRHAIIEVDQIRFYGDVEIHVESDLWFAHAHEVDLRYNNVILHVVLKDRHYREVHRFDGTSPFGLILQPYLTEKVNEVIRKTSKPEILPCAGSVSQIDPSIISRQLDKAAGEYFQAKIDEWTKWYDSRQEPSAAIQHLLALSLFDGLGISRNRKSMRRLFTILMERESKWQSLVLTDRIDYALKLAGITDSKRYRVKLIKWDYSASRPANQPDKRIPQAMVFLDRLGTIPFDNFLTENPVDIWNEIKKPSKLIHPVGKQRCEILYRTCFLPIMYLCGSVFQSHSLMEQTIGQWNRKPFVPDPSILKTFRRSGFPANGILHNTGTVYQLKNYCRQHRCDSCSIMKTILLS